MYVKTKESDKCRLSVHVSPEAVKEREREPSSDRPLNLSGPSLSGGGIRSKLPAPFNASKHQGFMNLAFKFKSAVLNLESRL